jgi:hypothetical protein
MWVRPIHLPDLIVYCLMKSAFFLLPLFMACNAGAQKTPVAETAAVQQTTPGFAVVELFTSEGCSSCPPADQALAQLQQQFAGKPVYLLAFHVDYWDYLGWADPFSNAAYSLRQRWYGQLFNLESIYTPQAIVNGQWQTTGSRKTAIAQQIETALQQPAGDSIQLSITATENNRLTVQYRLSASNTKNLVLVLVQKAAVTKVTRGENGGHSLQHVNVVRSYKNISPASATGEQLMEIPAGLLKDGYFVLGFLQDEQGNITGACTV